MIFDIVIIVVISLSLIAGLMKGFSKMLISFLGFALTAVIVYFLAKPFAGFLDSFIPFDAWINAPIENWLTGLSPDIMSAPITGTEAEVAASLTGAGIPGFIANLVVPWIMPYVPDAAAGTTAAQLIAPGITSIIILVIAAILLFILIRIGLMIIEAIMRKASSKSKGVNFVNKVLGMALGFAKSYLYVSVGLALIAVMMTFSFMAPVKAELQKSTLGKWLYNNNFIAELILGDITLEEPAQEETPSAETQDAKQVAYSEKSFKSETAKEELYFSKGVYYRLKTDYKCFT